MRKYILIFGLLSFIITSCSNNEDTSLFQESAAERLDKAIKIYKEILVSSKNGWAMEYYPNKKQVYGGFAYTFNFDNTNNKVAVRFDLLPSDRVTESKYDIIANGGPTLTFNTYNGLLHNFSTPNRYSPESLGGDYEFLILSYKDDEMLLKGKKTGTVMKMFKLKKSPTEYLDAVRSVYGSVVYSKFVSMTVNGKDIPIQKGGNRIFSATANFSDGKTTNNLPYIHTEEGIKIFESVTIDGVTISELKLDRQKGNYVSDDGKVVIKLSPFPPFSILDRWKAANGGELNSIAFNEVFENIKQANKEKYPQEKFYDTMLLGYANYNLTGVTFRSSDKAIHYFLRIQGVQDKPEQVALSGYSPGYVNWRKYTHLKPMVDLLINNSPYSVTLNSDGSKKLLSTKNPNVWFSIKK